MKTLYHRNGEFIASTTRYLLLNMKRRTHRLIPMLAYGPMYLLQHCIRKNTLLCIRTWVFLFCFKLFAIKFAAINQESLHYSIIIDNQIAAFFNLL